MEIGQLFLAKADECLAGAESELANGRYNNCANRCYYACFHAAVAALAREGVQPAGAPGQWGHGYVQGAFVGRLINRQKRYPAALRDVLVRTFALRQEADYGRGFVAERQAQRALQRTREFLAAIEARWETIR